MDARIILAGQGVNALQALTDGTRAAGLAGEVGQQGDLLSLYRNQGPGIAAGDQNALNALSQIDPMQALGVQESRQGMRIREEQLQMARASAARQAEEYARSISAEQREQERRQLEQGLASAIPEIGRAHV